MVATNFRSGTDPDRPMDSKSPAGPPLVQSHRSFCHVEVRGLSMDNLITLETRPPILSQLASSW